MVPESRTRMFPLSSKIIHGPQTLENKGDIQRRSVTSQKTGIFDYIAVMISMLTRTLPIGCALWKSVAACCVLELLTTLVILP